MEEKEPWTSTAALPKVHLAAGNIHIAKTHRHDSCCYRDCAAARPTMLIPVLWTCPKASKLSVPSPLTRKSDTAPGSIAGGRSEASRSMFSDYGPVLRPIELSDRNPRQ